MGKNTWEGWQKTVDDAAQPTTSIIYGANIRNKNEPTSKPEDGSDVTTEVIKVNQRADALQAKKRSAIKKQ